MSGHLGFVAVAYALAAVILGGLTLKLAFDYRALRRDLRLLQARGVKRRSEASGLSP